MSWRRHRARASNGQASACWRSLEPASVNERIHQDHMLWTNARDTVAVLKLPLAIVDSHANRVMAIRAAPHHCPSTCAQPTSSHRHAASHRHRCPSTQTLNAMKPVCMSRAAFQPECWRLPQQLRIHGRRFRKVAAPEGGNLTALVDKAVYEPMQRKQRTTFDVHYDVAWGRGGP